MLQTMLGHPWEISQFQAYHELDQPHTVGEITVEISHRIELVSFELCIEP
jgi:hypothetical protein